MSSVGGTIEDRPVPDGAADGGTIRSMPRRSTRGRRGRPPRRALRAAARHATAPHRAAPRRSAGPGWLARGALLLAVGAGLGLLVSGVTRNSDPLINELVRAAPPVTAPTPYMIRPAAAVAVARTRVVPVPTRLVVPTLGIDQPFIELGVGGDGRLQAPTTRTDIGWWSDGPAPGEPGAVVVAAHVSFNGAPGVFAPLSTMQPGQDILVTLSDGSAATYQVATVEQFAKTAFPDARVYSREGPTRLRLVTCGGAVDPATRHFMDNVVVFADLRTEPSPPGA